jgi:hypothetical protein
MKNLILFTGIIFCCLQSFAKKVAVTSPHATFEKIWVDYDITEDGLKGMRIHLNFTTYEMKDMDSYLAIYFNYNNERGGRLRDKNSKFNSTTGDVAVYQILKPQYDPAVYTDLQLFMPYSELDLDPGSYELSMDIELIYKVGGLIQKLTSYDFEYTKPAIGAPVTGTSANATFDKLWVDYDVTENGLKGMRIHVKFNLTNMKNVDAYLAIYFEKKDGEKLMTTHTAYQSKSGQVAIYKSLLPSYDNADYDNLELFMPYNEFNLGSGNFDLKMDIDVIYKNGDLLKHLDYHEFVFSQ